MIFGIDVKVLITVLGLVLAIIIAAIVLMIVARKTGQGITLSGKHKDNEIAMSVGKSDSPHKQPRFGRDKKPPRNNTGETEKPVVHQHLTFDSSQLIEHRFFNSAVYRYTSETCEFRLYESAIQHGIKNDPPDVAEFKKLIATLYLHKCLFEYIVRVTKDWAQKIVADATHEHPELCCGVPPSIYSIIGDFINYRKEARRRARELDFYFLGKQIHGIPNEFIDKFDNWSVRNMEMISSIAERVLYTQNLPWPSKASEILDMLEMSLDYMQNDVDATLILLNGEMERYVENLKKDNFQG